MMNFCSKGLSVSIDLLRGEIASLTIDRGERLAGRIPLFRLCLRDRCGEAIVLSARDAKEVVEIEKGAEWRDFQYHGTQIFGLTVTVSAKENATDLAWYLRVEGLRDEYVVEWIDAPSALLPKLRENDPEGRGGTVLLPYNEGALVSDATVRARTSLGHDDPAYPPKGCYAVFPNMIFSQFLAYLWDDAGLYIGAHDPDRAVKGIDYVSEGNGVSLRIRLFCGTEYGEAFRTDYPIVWAATGSRWESAAERYRAWFAEHLPPRVRKIAENPNLPAWYRDDPLVISYPVRGSYDSDEMRFNDLFFPYGNALPLIDELRGITGNRILVLLMHWEGTAPWAPPYVWPPIGGEEPFYAFRDALHARGDLLGVYCSGFSYTMESCYTPYRRDDEFVSRGIAQGVCKSPEGSIAPSKICTKQRKGYDLCPASPVGRAVVEEAYAPLFGKGIDYLQILDQNHGGGQYFCYAKDHGHPPVPGKWMTERMQALLGNWNDRAHGEFFGCESAAAEPFLGNLPFSDNRFELNYKFGRPVPLYAYCYHEYLRNFMGNQVSCPFRDDVDTLCHRIAYSFAAGDCITLVVDPNGNFLPRWGAHDLSRYPDREKVLRLVSNLTAFYRSVAAPFLYDGRMIPAEPLECETVTYPRRDEEPPIDLPALLTTAWENRAGARAQIVVNPEDRDISCTVGGVRQTVPALGAVLLPLCAENP